MKINSVTKEILEWIFCIVIAVVIALLVRYYIGTPTVVKNVSMNPTLIEGQRLWLNRWNRTIGKMPQRGDIITFEAPNEVSLSKKSVEEGKVIAKYSNNNKGILSKFVYYVLEINKTSYIKRVIALPGEHVLIENGKVYINGNELQEEYLQSGIVTDMGLGQVNDFTVPENCVFALGDNRTESRDSRVFGCIPLEKIESKVAIRFWPLNLFGKVK